MSADATVRDMEIEVGRVAELQREGEIQLIDVREDYEYDAGRIAGARHVALGEVAAQAETIERDIPVIFYCRVGGRSARRAITASTSTRRSTGWLALVELITMSASASSSVRRSKVTAQPPQALASSTARA